MRLIDTKLACGLFRTSDNPAPEPTLPSNTPLRLQAATSAPQECGSLGPATVCWLGVPSVPKPGRHRAGCEPCHLPLVLIPECYITQ